MCRVTQSHSSTGLCTPGGNIHLLNMHPRARCSAMRAYPAAQSHWDCSLSQSALLPSPAVKTPVLVYLLIPVFLILIKPKSPWCEWHVVTPGLGPLSIVHFVFWGLPVSPHVAAPQWSSHKRTDHVWGIGTHLASTGSKPTHWWKDPEQRRVAQWRRRCREPGGSHPDHMTWARNRTKPGLLSWLGGKITQSTYVYMHNPWTDSMSWRPWGNRIEGAKRGMKGEH